MNFYSAFFSHSYRQVNKNIFFLPDPFAINVKGSSKKKMFLLACLYECEKNAEKVTQTITC